MAESGSGTTPPSRGPVIHATRWQLRGISLIYLALPCVIFTAGFLRAWVALPAAGVLLLGLSLAIGRESREDRRRLAMSSGGLVLVLAAVTFIVAHSGVGGMGYLRAHSAEHVTLLYDLIEHDWPVVYTQDAQGQSISPTPLQASIGFYLPAAGVGKLLGYRAGCAALFAWAVLGGALAMLWFVELVGSRPLLAALLFCAASGLTVLGDVARFATGGEGAWSSFASHAQLITASPQWAIPGWIATALALEAWPRIRRADQGPLAAAMTTISSPWIAIGLLPLAVCLAVRHRRWAAMGLSMGIALPAGVYLGATVERGIGPLGSPWAVAAMQFGLLVIVAIWLNRTRTPPQPDQARRDNRWMAAAGAALLAWPLLVGTHAAVAALPALLVLHLMVARSVLSPGGRWFPRAVLIALLLLASIAPLRIAAESFARRHYALPSPGRTTALAQHHGRLDSRFFRLMAKEPGNSPFAPRAASASPAPAPPAPPAPPVP